MTPTAKLRSFSLRPFGPTAPGSEPPWPGSMTTSTSADTAGGHRRDIPARGHDLPPVSLLPFRREREAARRDHDAGDALVHAAPSSATVDGG